MGLIIGGAVFTGSIVLYRIGIAFLVAGGTATPFSMIEIDRILTMNC